MLVTLHLIRPDRGILELRELASTLRTRAFEGVQDIFEGLTGLD
jgi:hypothetical protein